MTKLLRVLLVEDSADDASLIKTALEREGYDLRMERVETSLDMKAALEAGPWDVILSDYVLPGFGGPEALQVLKDSGKDIPMILMSGHVGEDFVRTELLEGAADYVPKTNLTRLVPAIERERRAAAERRTLRAAHELGATADTLMDVNRELIAFRESVGGKLVEPLGTIGARLAGLLKDVGPGLERHQRVELELALKETRTAQASLAGLTADRKSEARMDEATGRLKKIETILLPSGLEPVADPLTRR